MELILSYVDQVLIFVIYAISLNLLQGYAGQVSVAHAAFGAVGGYVLAFLFLHQPHFTTLEGLGAAVIAAALVGLIVGLPALRLSTEWLILLTLSVQTIIILVALATRSLGGTYGLQNISGLTVFGHEIGQPSEFFPLFLGCAAIVFFVCWRMGESPYGRVLRGIRDDEIACRALGKNVFAYKIRVFGMTSGMAGLAGALLVINTTVSSPPLFTFDQSTAIVAMVVVGGAGNIFGPIVGVAALVLLGPLFEHVLNLGEGNSALWRLIFYGVCLVAILMLRPQGLLPDSARFRIRKEQDRVAEGVVEAPLPAVPLARNGSAPHGVVAVDANETVLAVSGLCKRFGGITAAENLDMVLRRGMITALVGPNGAGKTTVFNLLTGAIRPDAGRILLRGVDITGMRPDQVAKRGMVRSFQNVRVFPRLSSLENVMLGIQQQPGESLFPLFFRPLRSLKVERASRDRAMEWLRFVGIEDQANVAAGSLAFGQQKLVALARVLATEAEVLLLDEPASGIDYQWVDVMLELISKVRDQGRTVCIVEHNLHVVERLSDHTYFMELGRITAEGGFGELTSDKRLAEAYFGTA